MRKLREWRDGVTVLVRDRIALLQLLAPLGAGLVLTLALAMLCATLLPAATAAATGVLVAQTVAASGSGGLAGTVLVALIVLGTLLMANPALESVLGPTRNWAALRVNGSVRARIRAALSAPSAVDHLDDQMVRDAAALPVHDQPLFNLGAAAEGQLWLLARFTGAFACAALLARHFPLVALFELGAMLVQRAALRRQYAVVMASGIGRLNTDARAATYWRQVAGSALGGKELRLFGFGAWAIEEFATRNAASARLAGQLLSNALPRQWVTFSLSAFGSGVPFIVLTRASLAGELSTSELAVALGAVIGLFPIGLMGHEAFSIEAATPQLAALRRLKLLGHRAAGGAERTARPALEQELKSGTSSERTGPTIVFEDVWFRYPGAASDVLQGLDLRILPGESVAIVGQNGAGKTTLMKLLAGLYRPVRGRILVDGVDLASLDAAAWRRRLAVVFQDFTRFELSARENVALADIRRSGIDADVRAAADAAGALEFIEKLPHKWDTILSRNYAGGADLSGGQWQRIALARALYATKIGARVLVLDEPTASLDVEAEVALFDRLLTHARGLTAIVVSHRFSTVRRAKRIVVIGEGRVLEDGDHDELVARRGIYARLYELQASKFQDAPGKSGASAEPV